MYNFKLTRNAQKYNLAKVKSGNFLKFTLSLLRLLYHFYCLLSIASTKYFQAVMALEKNTSLRIIKVVSNKYQLSTKLLGLYRCIVKQDFCFVFKHCLICLTTSNLTFKVLIFWVTPSTCSIIYSEKYAPFFRQITRRKDALGTRLNVSY